MASPRLQGTHRLVAGRSLAVAALLAALALAQLPSTAAVSAVSSWNDGIITHFGGAQDGAFGWGRQRRRRRRAAALQCMRRVSPRHLAVVSLPPSNPDRVACRRPPGALHAAAVAGIRGNPLLCRDRSAPMPTHLLMPPAALQAWTPAPPPLAPRRAPAASAPSPRINSEQREPVNRGVGGG